MNKKTFFFDKQNVQLCFSKHFKSSNLQIIVKILKKKRKLRKFKKIQENIKKGSHEGISPRPLIRDTPQT